MSRTARLRFKHRTPWQKLVARRREQDQRFREESTVSKPVNTAMGAALSSAGVYKPAELPPGQGVAGAPPASTPLAEAQRDKQRKVRESKRAPYASFEQAAAALNFTPRDLAERVGYSRHASSTWSTEGECPYVAVVAAQGLVSVARLQHELAGKRRQDVQVLLVSISPGGEVTATPVDAEDKITLNGATYVKFSNES